MAEKKPAKAGRKQDGTFAPGVSGNPQGRRQGSRSRATLAVEALLDGQLEALTSRCIKLALDGDSAALRLVMERLCPARKERPVTVTLPNAIKTPEDVSKAMDKVTKAAAGGELTPSEARTLTGLLESRLKVIETQEIVARLEALERAIKR